MSTVPPTPLLPSTPPPTPRGSVNYDKNVQSMQRLRHSMIGNDDLFDEFTSSSSSVSHPFISHSHQQHQYQHQHHQYHSFHHAALPEDDAMTSIPDNEQHIDSNNNNKTTVKKQAITISRNKQRDQKQTKDDTATVVIWTSCILTSLGQVPAILLIGMFHLMIGIPFGVSYFPIGWASSTTTSGLGDDENNNNTYSINTTTTATTTAGDASNEDVSLMVGTFPLTSGKEALGIRMFLFATMIGQVVYVFKSGFVNPIGLQMVENIPFCHALARLCIAHQGFGMPALSTLLFLFGLSSVLVGMVFFVLGYLELGRIVYYFPNHVLVGLIAGIGVFLAKTALEITMAAEFSLQTIWQSLHLVRVVFGLEILLRLLDRFLRHPSTGKPYCSLLSPLYFCSITPFFYLVLWIIRVPVQDAIDAGYFFPPIDATDNASGGDDSSSQNGTWSGGGFVPTSDLLDLWRIVDFRTISWQAVGQAIPTLISLILFSLIHVPINIPAFALSTNTDVDMNVELIAHGYSNIISGLAGGLQNYMAYTQSVIYAKSGGTGKVSGIVVAIVTLILFVIGPTLASYIPRCMAGTLLLHVGIDLFLEGIYDSFHRFDWLEYASVWLIIIVMTVYGMDAAMLAGLLTAIFTFVAQNMTYVDPLRGAMSAATLRSDVWNRHHDALAILENVHTGRSRILVIQLQGNLFFGNMAHFTKAVTELLRRTRSTRMFKKEVGTMSSIAEDNDDNSIRGIGDSDSFQEHPLVVILDFSLVLGIDSSAAQAMTRLKNNMREQFHVELSIFVSGSPNGFPCAFDLSKELTTVAGAAVAASSSSLHSPDESTCLLQDEQQLKSSSFHHELEALLMGGSRVAETLNMALAYAENFLIARENPDLLDEYTTVNTMTTNTGGIHKRQLLPIGASLSDEHDVALEYLNRLCSHEVERRDCETLLSRFEREMYHQGEFIWKQGSTSTSIKLLLQGTLISILENEAGTNETISAGNTIGELGVMTDIPRLSSIQCLSDEAIVYSLSREAYHELLESSPHVARLLDLICIRYLSARVQHVSNRIFETRCLPI